MVDNNCIIEGNVKFRDGKKWKSRWCVMRKLSPVADCLHLQLYGDSKDRYKQGQTKASLSLQHFLGVQSGFTLDKESNTIAIICQDVTVVLAFDTRERLIQWQVKISNNLGEDLQFLILLSSAPAKAKLSSGPGHLHLQERRFCMTLGMPPRLAGVWEIGQLRRYGVVEGRFCFEGGSRCGRGEGLHVLVTEQADEIDRALQLAAEGKLATRRRASPTVRQEAGSPLRQQFSRLGGELFPAGAATSATAASSPGTYDERCDGFKTDATSSSAYWSSTESHRHRELDCCETQADYSPRESSVSLIGAGLAEQGRCSTAGSAVGGMPTADWRSCSLSRQHTHHHQQQQQQQLQNGEHHRRGACLERCSSCIGKLGGSSGCKSTTTLAACTPLPGHLTQSGASRAFDRVSLSSYTSSGSSSAHDSDYSGSQHQVECRCSPQPAQQQQQQQPPALAANRPSHSPGSPTSSSAVLGLPPRPPKPGPAGAGAPKRARKPPMPLPPAAEQACTCVHKTATSPRTVAGPYENYDIPKSILAHQTPVEPQSPQAESHQFYDTPKKIKECLAATKAYPNYDTPHVPQPVVLQQCGCPAKLASHTPKSLACPCHNVMSWAGFVLPYCRRGAGIEHTGVSVQPVRLSGEGKMPVVNASGQLGIYNSASNGSILESSQASANASADPECPVHSSSVSATSNYENIDSALELAPAEAKAANYANIEFTESLGNYENSKDLLAKLGGSLSSRDKIDACAEQQQKDAETEDNKGGGDEKTTKICRKCGHLKERSEDYLVVDEENEDPQKPISGYIPMQPAHNVCSKEILSRLCSGVKSSSNPTLSGFSPLEVSRKRSESEYRVPGSAMLSSPYFRRRLLEVSNSEAGGSLGMLLRKRSYSAESAHYLDDEKTTSFTPNVPIHKCHTNDADLKTSLASREAAGAVGAASEANDSLEDATPLCAAQQPLASIKIRRSSSVPSKTGHNRDSSSSNDSGVSTGSLSHRTTEFVEFEFPSTSENALVKKQSVPLMYRKSPPPACFHSSLPRKSKSSDPIKELTFQFHKSILPAKSSSAEADIPTCLPSKASKEFSSPGEVTSAPYIDSRSTSSGTSDMSDYIETLSLSSHSSSDAPDNLRLGGRTVTTTLRPRSGKEYYKIDRSILVEQGRANNSTASSNYTNVAPFARKEIHQQQQQNT